MHLQPYDPRITNSPTLYVSKELDNLTFHLFSAAINIRICLYLQNTIMSFSETLENFSLYFCQFKKKLQDN